MNRKELLHGILLLPALAAGIAAASTGTAQAKGTKAQFKYQDHPNGKSKCSGCTLFIPNKNAKLPGTCKVVEGAISPNGWCTAFSPKS